MTENTVTAEQVGKYLKVARNRAGQSLIVLRKHAPFVEAIQTEIGQELLKDAVGTHEDLLSKIAAFTATPEEAADYRAIHRVILKWSDRIDEYNKDKSQ